MLSTQQIQYILSLAELRNFSRAAEACYITQPTLSMQVRKAEEIVGFPIFDRDRTPLELTRHGKELIPLLREIDADFQQISRLKKQVRGEYLEEIRMGIIPTISAYLIPALYSRWKTLLPSIRLIIEEKKSEEILESLLAKKIDLGIMAGPADDTTLKTIPLYTEEIKAYIPSASGKTGSITPESLRAVKPWLLNKGNCLRTQMMAFCEIHEQDPDSWDYEGGNLEMLLRMVDLNGGYTLVPEHYQSVLALESARFRKICDPARREVPARSVIALVQHRNSKWKSIEPVLRDIQLHFAKAPTDKLRVLQ